MSSIPGAHASLGFGRKRVEFYAAPGVTAGAAAHRGEHEIRDMDGQSHILRLSRPDTPLESGENVTVLRLQSGPDHESRPVALINHDRNAWTRTAPDATGILGRSGITRGLNWWLSMILFMVTALAFSWPDIRLFMLEVDPALFAALPDLNVFEMARQQFPILPGFDLAAVIPGFSGVAGQVSLAEWLTPNVLAFAAGLLVLALFTYFARSWRIIWVPAYAAAALAAGLALGAIAPLIPSMLALAGVGLLFCLGGIVNRTRDSARLEGRIARLSENILRNPPREGVSAPAAAGAALSTGVAADAVIEAAEPAADQAEAPEELAVEEAAELADESVDDDLPSDEALAAARADVAPADEDMADPAPVPSLRASQEDGPETRDPDRDMIMPPPPPLANRSVSDNGDAGEAGEPDDTPVAEAEAAGTTPDAVAATPETADTPQLDEGPEAGDDEQDPFLSSSPAREEDDPRS
ncbi:hypothetical protein V0U79_11435 [Hyphobacterium sp. HN65]|uniref:Uncharacterized protein n=1 Tax=Hyphobacterium lacteum TaxID=3116575 RepID=A0ABU7LST6_9PROT|nr:hypothetical protein [Hyphobacterium sp. HN65]MEE2526983.1 hypothetical protein [Hyphobacterium sp. HN65]